MTVKPAIIPCLRYADAPAAIDFLCAAFGFERHAVYADDKDPSLIHHAQLIDRGYMIMLASLRRFGLGRQGRPEDGGAGRRQHPDAAMS